MDSLSKEKKEEEMEMKQIYLFISRVLLARRRRTLFLVRRHSESEESI
jgi:hypothetical protein